MKKYPITRFVKWIKDKRSKRKKKRSKKVKGLQSSDLIDDLYGNNSLSGFQQRKEPQIKEEYEKGLVEIIKDKLSVRRKRKGHQL